MNKLKGSYWALSVLLVAAVITVAYFRRTPRLASETSPPLGAVSSQKNLPAQFRQRLDALLGENRARPADMEPVRKLARLYHANGLYAEARSCYKVVAANAGGLVARDHYYLADIAQNENQLTEANAELRAVLVLQPDYLPARLALAQALFKTGDAEGARNEYSTALTIESDQPQASLGLARIDLQKGDDAAALARLEELMAAHPEFTSGAALLAQLLERVGQSDRATAVTQLSLQKPESPPADPWLAELLADCYDVQRLSLTFEEYFKTGRMAEALPLLDRLSQLDPESPITKIFSGFSHAQALQHIKAVRDYYDALGKGGDPEKICPYLVQSLLELGKISEAENLLVDYSEKLPDSIPIAKAYAEVALRQNNSELAATLLSKILAKEPYLYSQNMSLAKILWTSGERDQAAVCLERVASVQLNDVASRALLAEHHLDKGNPIVALRYLKEAYPHATAKTPVHDGLTALLTTAYVQAGHGEIERGHLQDGANYYQQAIELAPDNLEAHAGKASTCVQLKQFPQAAAALEKLVSLQPENPTIYLSLGDVVYQGGDRPQAERHWQKALQLTPATDADLRTALVERLAGQITAETFR